MNGPVSGEEKQMAMFAHASNIFLWGIGPVLIYFLKKDTSKFVHFHALQSIYMMIAGFLLTCITCGIGAFPVLIINVIAAMKANNGEMYEYPVVGEMARKTVYGR